MITAVLAAAVHFTLLTAARAAVARALTVEMTAGCVELALVYRVVAEDDGNALVAQFVGAEVYGNGGALDAGDLGRLGVDPYSPEMGRALAFDWAADCIRRASAAAG